MSHQQTVKIERKKKTKSSKHISYFKVSQVIVHKLIILNTTESDEITSLVGILHRNRQKQRDATTHLSQNRHIQEKTPIKNKEVFAGTKLSASIAASPQLLTKKRGAPPPPPRRALLLK